MKQNFVRGTFAALVLLVAALPLSGQAPDCAGQAWAYANPSPRSDDERGVLVVQPSPGGYRILAGKDSATLEALASLTLDGAQPGVFQGQSTRLEYRRSAGGLSLLWKDEKGDSSLSVKGAAIDIQTLMFFPGFLPLQSRGQELLVQLVIPGEKSLEAHEAWAKIKGEKALDLAGKRFQAMEIEMGLTGIKGLVAPRFNLWIDRESRMLLKLQGPNATLQLVGQSQI